MIILVLMLAALTLSGAATAECEMRPATRAEVDSMGLEAAAVALEEARDAMRIGSCQAERLQAAALLADIRVRQGRYEGAIEYLEETLGSPALSGAAGDPTRELLASVLSNAGRADEAVEIWKRLAASSDSSPLARIRRGFMLLNLASTYEMLDRSDEMQEALLKATMEFEDARDWPAAADSRLRLAGVLAKQGNLRASTTEFEHCIRLSVENADAPRALEIRCRTRFAEFLEEHGNVAEAQAHRDIVRSITAKPATNQSTERGITERNPYASPGIAIERVPD